jgi:hypothetical protein
MAAPLAADWVDGEFSSILSIQFNLGIAACFSAII